MPADVLLDGEGALEPLFRPGLGRGCSLAVILHRAVEGSEARDVRGKVAVPVWEAGEEGIAGGTNVTRLNDRFCAAGEGGSNPWVRLSAGGLRMPPRQLVWAGRAHTLDDIENDLHALVYVALHTCCVVAQPVPLLRHHALQCDHLGGRAVKHSKLGLVESSRSAEVVLHNFREPRIDACLDNVLVNDVLLGPPDCVA